MRTHEYSANTRTQCERLVKLVLRAFYPEQYHVVFDQLLALLRDNERCVALVCMCMCASVRMVCFL